MSRRGIKFINIPHKFSLRMEQRSHHILWPKHKTYKEPVKKTNSGDTSDLLCMWKEEKMLPLFKLAEIYSFNFSSITNKNLPVDKFMT